MAVKFHPHARERLRERGASENEVIKTVETGERDFQQSLGEVDLDAISLLTVCGEVRNTEQNR